MQQNSMRDLDHFMRRASAADRARLSPSRRLATIARDIWLTREEVRAASLGLAENIASERKRLVFLFCGNSCETLIGLLAAAAARSRGRAH